MIGVTRWLARPL